MKTINFLAVMLFSLAIASCGGGGGSGTTSSTTHNISGKVAGAANVTITLTGAVSKTTTSANGNYSFKGLANGSYTITPSLPGYVFTPTSIAVILKGANDTVKTSTATANTTQTYCLSGTVSGASVQNVVITLNGANTGSTVTDANGNYSFCGLVNGDYTITPTIQGYSFDPLGVITINSVNSSSNNLISAVAQSGGKVVFEPKNPLPSATVGEYYSNSVIGSITGGTSPYYYQSDSFVTGAPPIGMIVDLNGNLRGTPHVPGTYTFGVCAVDLVGAFSCKTTKITVSSPSVSGNWYFHWNCNGDYECLTLNPAGLPSGTSYQGWGSIGQMACHQIISSGTMKYWGSAATYSCNQSPN